MEKSFSTKTFTDFTGQNLSELTQFGKVYLFDTVSSTQNIAKGLIAKKEQALVIALNQTKGQGRFRRKWHSETGGLYFSQLLFPDISVKDKSAQMIMLVALAIARSLESLTNQKCELRWPNDIIFGGKKIGGVLCETKQEALIIGVGLNLNQTYFPTSLTDATSLYIEQEQEYEIGKILILLLTNISELYQEFIAGKFLKLLSEIKSRQVLINQRVRVDLWFRHIEGNFIGLDNEGRLVLRTDTGRLMTITAGKMHRIVYK